MSTPASGRSTWRRGIRARPRASASRCGSSPPWRKDEYLEREQTDTEEILAWLAEQPWCDGRTGMMGVSCGAFAALQVAARQPPSPRAIVTASFTDDRYADDMHYMGGALLSDNLAEAGTMFAYATCPPDPAVVGERWREMWHERLEHTRPWVLEWLRHQRRDDYWRHASVCEEYQAARLSDVAPDGRATRVTYGVLNLTHRGGTGAPEPLEPGRRYRATVRLNGVAQAFPPGHRIRLSLSTSYWPLAWPPPRPVLLTVYEGSSALTLPLRGNHEPDEVPQRPFGEPEGAPPLATTQLDPPEMRWDVTRDLVGYRSGLEIVKDAGTVRYEDIGLDVGRRAYERYAAVADDFASVRASPPGPCVSGATTGTYASSPTPSCARPPGTRRFPATTCRPRCRPSGRARSVFRLSRTHTGHSALPDLSRNLEAAWL
ncbi:CocE/NonD family hydrolase [Streptomyces sp. NPDC021212]|uniref:CocE/NonD family hydrolase n=1 Tax=Streptomyces sp. NPDC021212 TaxID=3365118 RepID=UPI0037937F58